MAMGDEELSASHGGASQLIARAQEEAVVAIGKCTRLAGFLRKRLDLEQQYAGDLRKLCREYGLEAASSFSSPPCTYSSSTSPPTKFKLFARHGHRGPSSLLMSSTLEAFGESSLWRGFYDAVDDTSQVAKAHGMLAETLGAQVLEPLQAAIKSMDVSRRSLVEEGAFLRREEAEARNALKKAAGVADTAQHDSDHALRVLQALQARGDIKSRPLDKAKLRAQVASERAMAARQQQRQCEERLRTLLARQVAQEAPRLLQEFRRQEAQRSFDAYKIVHALGELERQRLDLEDRAVREMLEHVAGIDLSADLGRFDALFLAQSRSGNAAVDPRAAMLSKSCAAVGQGHATNAGHGSTANAVGSKSFHELLLEL
jgi:hypothetical protein